MNAAQNKPKASGIADVQNLADTRQIAINRVGIKSIRHPVKILDRSGGQQSLPREDKSLVADHVWDAVMAFRSSAS